MSAWKQWFSPEFWSQHEKPWALNVWYFLRFCRFVLDGFIRNRCPLRAAALAYTTLLALIPLLAIVVGILTSMLKTDEAKGEEMIEQFIETLVANVAPALDLVDRAEEKLKEENGVQENQDQGGSTSTNPAEENSGTGNVLDPQNSENSQATVTTKTTVLVNDSPEVLSITENGVGDGVSAAPDPDEPAISANDSKGLSAEDLQLNGRKEVVSKIMDFIDNVNSGSLGVTGAITLILVAISLLSTIEGTFNDIWLTSRGRGLFDQMVNYWAAITLGPLLIAVAFTSGPYLRSLEIWLAKAPVKPQFSEREIKDPLLLARKLATADQSAELAFYLFNEFSSETRQQVRDWAQINSSDEALEDGAESIKEKIKAAKATLASELNEIISSGAIYSESRFSDIYLDQVTREWLKKNPQKSDLNRLNRLLLEQAFPVSLSPTHVSRLRSLLEGLAAPFLILMMAFVLFYKFMPFAEVQWRAALVGGSVGAFLWQTNISFSVIYISKVVSDSRIYSGFGMLPLFLLGLYISWLIVLLGAQVTYTFQNRLVLFQQQQVHLLPQREREFVALWILAQIATCFDKGNPPPTEMELAGELDLSVNSLDPIMKRLKDEGILIELARKSPSFAPGRPLEKISCQDVLDCMRSSPNELPFDPESLKGHSPQSAGLLSSLRTSFEAIVDAEKKVASQISILDLVTSLSERNSEQMT